MKCSHKSFDRLRLCHTSVTPSTLVISLFPGAVEDVGYYLFKDQNQVVPKYLKDLSMCLPATCVSLHFEIFLWGTSKVCWVIN